MKPKKPLTVKESLAKLETQQIESPEPIQPIQPIDLTHAVINLQNNVAGMHFALEATLDLLKAFDVIDMNVFNIAFQNVIEFDQVPEESRKVLEIRLRALKKKLADYNKSRGKK